MDNRKDTLEEYQSRLKKKIEENKRRLTRPVTIFEGFVAQWAVLFSRLGMPTAGTHLSASEIRQVNECYQSLFPSTLPEQAQELLRDPEAYQDKVNSYQQCLPGEQAIAFPTGNDFDALTKDDPLRIQEELFVLQTMLQCETLSTTGRFNVVDLGSGSGRLTRSLGKSIAALLPREHIRIIGLEIDRANIEAALGDGNWKTLNFQVGFVQGDLLHPPLRPETVSFCVLGSVLQLIPVQQRVLLLQEVVRLLKTGGWGVLTGPNEKCSLEGYIRSTFAAYPDVYLNPVNSYKAFLFAPLAQRIDRLCRERADYRYPDTREVCKVMELLGCQIESVETWPRYHPNEDIFTGLSFTKTGK